MIGLYPWLVTDLPIYNRAGRSDWRPELKYVAAPKSGEQFGSIIMVADLTLLAPLAALADFDREAQRTLFENKSDLRAQLVDIDRRVAQVLKNISDRRYQEAVRGFFAESLEYRHEQIRSAKTFPKFQLGGKGPIAQLRMDLFQFCPTRKGTEDWSVPNKLRAIVGLDPYGKRSLGGDNKAHDEKCKAKRRGFAVGPDFTGDKNLITFTDAVLRELAPERFTNIPPTQRLPRNPDGALNIQEITDAACAQTDPVDDQETTEAAAANDEPRAPHREQRQRPSPGESDQKRAA